MGHFHRSREGVSYPTPSTWTHLLRFGCEQYIIRHLFQLRLVYLIYPLLFNHEQSWNLEQQLMAELQILRRGAAPVDFRCQ